MNSFGITDRGKVRRDNQDSFLIERIEGRDALIAVLCDGMGGEKAGNIASDLAAKTYAGVLRQRFSGQKLKGAEIPEAMAAACAPGPSGSSVQAFASSLLYAFAASAPR